jgi:hypothetical protein
LKLVAWRKKMLFDLHRRASLPSELLSLDLLRPFVLEKDEWFRTDSGTSYRLSKSKAPLSCRKAQLQPKENTTTGRISQQEITDFHRNSQAGGGDCAKAFIGKELRSGRGLNFANQCWIYFAFEIRLAGFAGRKKEIGGAREKREIRNTKLAGGGSSVLGHGSVDGNRTPGECESEIQKHTDRSDCATRRDA